MPRPTTVRVDSASTRGSAAAAQHCARNDNRKYGHEKRGQHQRQPLPDYVGKRWRLCPPDYQDSRGEPEQQWGRRAGTGQFSTLHSFRGKPYVQGMTPGQVREALDRAIEAVMGSRMARTEAVRLRKAWHIWRSHWAELERLPPAERVLGVCMYCERIRINTGEWVATPPALTEML